VGKPEPTITEHSFSEFSHGKSILSSEISTKCNKNDYVFFTFIEIRIGFYKLPDGKKRKHASSKR